MNGLQRRRIYSVTFLRRKFKEVHVAEFDFAGWVGRARAFTLGLGHLPATEVRSTSVAAPLDEADLRSLEGALGASLPASLRAFFNRGTSAMDCAYIFKPEGQALAQLLDFEAR